jgi:hypothetical protein
MQMCFGGSRRTGLLKCGVDLGVATDPIVRVHAPVNSFKLIEMVLHPD